MSNPIINPPRSTRDIATWQRALWTLLPLATLGLASWAPFVYWANRRNYGSGDQRWWIAFTVATVAEVVLVATSGDDANAWTTIVGAYVCAVALAGAVLTWIKLAPKRM